MFVCSDAALKEYLVWLDKQSTFKPFIIHELDQTHLFITADPTIQQKLQQKIDDWHDANSFKEDYDEGIGNNANGTSVESVV